MAKAEGAVFKCLHNIPRTVSWESCKKILRENFSNLQTKNHASGVLVTRAQRPDETLQEYIYQYSELVKMVTGVEPSQVTSLLVISLFNRHLFNREIKKSVSKSDYRNLKEAFDSALAAER